MLKDKLDGRKDLQHLLYCKGFLITNEEQANLDSFPYYGNWNAVKLGEYFIYTHNETNLFVHKQEDGNCYFLIGHAFNPIAEESNEDTILQAIAKSGDTRSPVIDELTGIFILGHIRGTSIWFELDCSGMQYGCYGNIRGKAYICSHMQMLGDICGLEQSDFVKRLVSYRWYHYMMGNYLPGDITSFEEIKRIIPNTVVAFDGEAFCIERIYPNRPIEMCETEEAYQEVIRKGARILQNTMAIIPQKWKQPAISLTGGIDSNTTFAAANGNYDKYSTFSYVSQEREAVDAEAAEKISGKFGLPHTTYQIPSSNDEIADYDIIKEILDCNDGYIGTYRDNEARKKIYLIQNRVCDVEVKSWVSETIRAYAYKYYGRTKMPKSLKPRHYTSLYKIFLFNRKLALETDKYFADYMQRTSLKEKLYNYDESDFFVWEMMHGGKCGLDIGVMRMCFDVTIPYNNRTLLDLLLRVPLEKRVSDTHHLDLKKRMNQELFDMQIRIVNLNETNFRKKVLNGYFVLNSFWPW